MTATTRNSQCARRSSGQAELPRRWDLLCRGFNRWVRGYLKKHFHAVRLSRGSRPSVSPSVPLIVVLNHAAWWDPLIGMVLAALFPERLHYAPMDARALERYSLFSRLGFYPVEQGSSNGAISFLRTTTAVLSRPNSAVWITAQGRYADPRLRPPRLRSGVGHLVRRMNHVTVVTLALEYAFWDEPLPEALARFGEPNLIESSRSRSVHEWVERIESDLAATQDALKADSVSRNAARFETLLTGNATRRRSFGP
jgi:1-acyl-sn-glycerol-3-phosphate acyltransferase